MESTQKEPGFYLSVIIVIAAIGALLFSYYSDFFKKDSTDNVEPVEEAVDTTEQVDTNFYPTYQYPEMIPSSAPDGVDYNAVSFTYDNELGYIIGLKRGALTKEELNVAPYEITIANRIPSVAIDKKEIKMKINNEWVDSGMGYYKIGTVGNGAFAGKDIYGYLAEEGMGGPFLSHYLIPLEENYFFAFAEDGHDGFRLQPYTLLDKALFPGNNFVLTKGYPQLIRDPKITDTFSYQGQTFNIINDACITSDTSDGRFMTYNISYPLTMSDDYNVVNVTFDNGSKNTDRYAYSLSACNYFCTSPSFTTITDDDIKNGVYSVVGTTPDGSKVYAYTDPNNSAYVALYNDKNTAAYIQIDEEYHVLDQNKYTYDEFVASYPMLFWQDVFGNWVKFSNERFQPMAEKCKPVIYLYPEEETKLNVQVTPNGGFTKTIPEYPTGGWNVSATSDSQITDLLTGTIYPYLYWSGIGNNYPVDYTIGSVVARNDISDFLDEKLTMLGLNQIEINDFKEYWVEKLSEADFYQMYFLSKEQIDQMDPLQITPLQPDNVIRVMLTARPLEAKISLQEQVFPPTPRRDGFTVVEWGGVLLR